MKTLFTFLILAIYSLAGLAGPVINDVAVEGYPGDNHVVNGRYKYYATATTGHREFRSDRTDGIFLNPLTMSWDNFARRWEINVTKMVGGASTRVTVATSTFTGTNPPVKGWSVLYPLGNPLGLHTSLKVYETVTQYSLCDECRWSSPATWSSGFLPRAYDNVVINSNVILDIDGHCNNLKINPATTARFEGYDLTATGIVRLKLHGNLDVGISGRLAIFSLELAGNTRQTLQRNSERGDGVSMQRAIINNPYGVRLLSTFGFLSLSTRPPCETQFIKGKIFLDNYLLSCQTITGANADRYVVTNSTGYLVLPRNTVGMAYNQFFPIGSSDASYTPLRISNTTTSWRVTLAARAEYAPSLFPSIPHVNVIYKIANLGMEGGVVYPRWTFQAYWNAADESEGFSHSSAVRVAKRTETGWIGTESVGIPTGTGPFSYVYNSGSIDNFGIWQDERASASLRSAAVMADENAQSTNQDREYGSYPNPATSAGFKVRVDRADDAKIKLVSLSGTSIRFRAEKESVHTISLLPLDAMFPGIYILQVQEKNLVRTHKVVIK